MFFEQLFLFSNLFISHFRESEVVFPNVCNAKIVDLSHRQAFGWAYRCTKATKATFAHVDIKSCCINALRCTVGGLSDFFSCFNGHDVDTINRTNFSTLIANDTIINLIMETVSAIIGYGLHLIRILNSGNPFAIIKIFIVGNGTYFLRMFRFEHMLKRDPQTHPQRADSARDVRDV